MTNGSHLAHVERLLNDGDVEGAAELMIEYAELRSAGTVAVDDDSEQVFERMFADIVGMLGAP